MQSRSNTVISNSATEENKDINLSSEKFTTSKFSNINPLVNEFIELPTKYKKELRNGNFKEFDNELTELWKKLSAASDTELNNLVNKVRHSGDSMEHINREIKHLKKAKMEFLANARVESNNQLSELPISFSADYFTPAQICIDLQAFAKSIREPVSCLSINPKIIRSATIIRYGHTVTLSKYLQHAKKKFGKDLTLGETLDALCGTIGVRRIHGRCH